MHSNGMLTPLTRSGVLSIEDSQKVQLTPRSWSFKYSISRPCYRGEWLMTFSLCPILHHISLHKEWCSCLGHSCIEHSRAHGLVGKYWWWMDGWTGWSGGLFQPRWFYDSMIQEKIGTSTCTCAELCRPRLPSNQHFIWTYSYCRSWQYLHDFPEQLWVAQGRHVHNYANLHQSFPEEQDCMGSLGWE